MANKQYISIIRLFDHCGISTSEDLNLLRVKKQLQAEFGIARHGFIEVDGYTYTRHDVFEEIDHPKFQKRLAFHKQLWNSKPILQLLEKNVIDFNAFKTDITFFLSNKEFDEFFSPYFVGPFNYLSRTMLADSALKEMGELLAYEDFLQPADREEAFRPIRIFLDENVRILRNVNKENYKIMRSKISHWIKTDWFIFFNNLPHEFYEIKNDITTYLINIGVAIQKTHRRDCRKMSEQLVSLQDIPGSLMDIIVSNHSVYTSSSKTTRTFSWGNGFWILWVFFMVFRAIGSDGCNGNKTDYRELRPFELDKYVIPDSLVKIIKDSSFNIHRDTLSR